jgi:hypothetical protein
MRRRIDNVPITPTISRENNSVDGERVELPSAPSGPGICLVLGACCRFGFLVGELLLLGKNLLSTRLGRRSKASPLSSPKRPSHYAPCCWLRRSRNSSNLAARAGA